MQRILTAGFVILTVVTSFWVAAEFTHDNQEAEGSRIIGGYPAAEGHWPFIVSIGRIKEDGSRWHFCGGSIWDEETILTAAHCLGKGTQIRNKTNLNVYAGHTNLSNPDEKYLFKVRSLKMHEGYNHDKKLNDIAIIKLDRKILFKTDHPQARCLCQPESIKKLNSSDCFTLGWGYTKPRGPDSQEDDDLPGNLLQVHISIRSHKLCKKVQTRYQPVHHVCAGHTNMGACKLDSGGPLVCPHLEHPKAYVLVGVTSFMGESCRIGPTYFARVQSYLEWIENAAQEGPALSKAQLNGLLFTVALVGVIVAIWIAQSHRRVAQKEKKREKTSDAAKTTTSSQASTPTEKSKSN